MWGTAFRRHCSDETLLGYLDGELSRPTAAAVKRHLEACWECRTNLVDLQEGVQTIARALYNDSFLDPGQVAKARSRFLAWERGFRQDIDPAPKLRLLPASSAKRILAISLGILLLLAGLGIWLHFRAVWPQPAYVLAKVHEYEASQFQGGLPVRQSFRVEIREVRPAPSRSIKRLEVWSEASGSRFAGRWENGDGTSARGVFRTQPGQEYVYSPAVSRQAVARRHPALLLRTLADLWAFGLDPERLEAAMIEWLASRSWRPVSFAREFYLLANEKGVALWVEHARSDGREPVVRLLARRNTTRGVVELVLEMAPGSYRPRLQGIRFETPDRMVELRMIPERTENVSTERFVQAMFLPNVPARQPRRRPSAPPSPADRRPSGAAGLFTEALSLAGAEIEARYALHRVRACLGEPVEVLTTPSGYIQVLGLAKNGERKAQLLAALADLESRALIKTDILTIDEAATESRPEATRQRIIELQARKLPIHVHLERYFEKRLATFPLGEKGQNVERMITELSNEAVSLSESILAEAWSLRRLAERYGRTRTTDLRPRARWLLEVMFRDHVASLREQTERARQRLEPVMSYVAQQSSPLLLLEPDLSPGVADTSWRDDALTLFYRADKLQRLLHALFASAGLPEGQTASDVRDSVSALKRLGREVETFERQLTREFLGPAIHVSQKDLPN